MNFMLGIKTLLKGIIPAAAFLGLLAWASF
jgi:hypothetical protein